VEQGWPSATTKQRWIYVRDGVRGFMSAPGEQQEDLRETAGTEGQASGKAVHPGIRTEIAANQGHLAFVGHERNTQRQIPNGMLEALTEQHDIGCTKAEVLIAAQRGIAVDICSTKCWLKVDRKSTRLNSSH